MFGSCCSIRKVEKGGIDTNFLDLILNGEKRGLSKDDIADLLKTDRATLDLFESKYRQMALSEAPEEKDNFFDINSRDASAMARSQELPEDYDEEQVSSLISRIVDELLTKTAVMRSDESYRPVVYLPATGMEPVQNEALRALPAKIRPQLTGNLMKVDVNAPSYVMLLQNWKQFKEGKTPDARLLGYNMFRQGLDILDLDPITYEMLSMNPNSMSHWLPAISAAAKQEGFFRIPETKIAKVPLTLLQLTRLDYGSLSMSTLKIVDDWAMKAFDLDVNKSYFIKTGTYSSKFDFRNAKVTGEKEVRELGEYLLYIHHQAVNMASPLCRPSIYGVSTTNEWVVREFIEDVEDNPCIYKGLPLHTEYRVFVDFDTDEILGVNPYWDPNVMKQRFSAGSENSVHDYHDYIIYKAHEEVLMRRYTENVDTVVGHVKQMLPYVQMTGQWSIDIMQNGNDFWLIDMATAATSALKFCVPVEKLKRSEENWLPDLHVADSLEE